MANNGPAVKCKGGCGVMLQTFFYCTPCIQKMQDGFEAQIVHYELEIEKNPSLELWMRAFPQLF